jgi:predicted NBD/HSP70 family sugar kinase
VHGSRAITPLPFFLQTTYLWLDNAKSMWLSSVSMAQRTRKYPNPMESAGQLLELIRQEDGLTRADLAEITGLARSTVTQRVDLLLADDLVVEAGEARSTGGRPPIILRFNSGSGVVLVADLGATHARFAVTTLEADVLAERSLDLLIADGPERVLETTQLVFDDLLEVAGRRESDVRGVGIGVPGPVNVATGRPADPPIMTGWNDFPVSERFIERYNAPVRVDNDVNIMALGEFWSSDAAADDMVFVKVGTGIGSGLIFDGQLHRGATGAAGDIGHIHAGASDAVCRCGNLGCLEASAGGGALVRQLSELGRDVEDARDVVALAASGDSDAVQAIRDAGRTIGDTLAGVVNLLNPAEVVIGGDIAEAGQPLLAGIRETIYRRSTTLNTNELTIRISQLGDRAGVIGAAALVIERILDPVAIDAALSEREEAVA